AVQRYLVIIVFDTPNVDRNRAAEAPAGPEPTISTSVSTTAVLGGAVSASPSLKVTMVAAFVLVLRPLRRTLRTDGGTPPPHTGRAEHTWRKRAKPGPARCPRLRGTAHADGTRRSADGVVPKRAR